MRSKEFQLRLSEEEVLYVKVIYFADSLFIYIGDDNLQMSNGYIGIQTKYDKIPSVHKFLDEDNGERPEHDVEMMCKAITKRLNKVITLSINVPVEDPFKLRNIQEALIQDLLKFEKEENIPEDQKLVKAQES